MSDAEDRGMELMRQAAMQRGATARAVANANTHDRYVQARTFLEREYQRAQQDKQNATKRFLSGLSHDDLFRFLTLTMPQEGQAAGTSGTAYFTADLPNAIPDNVQRFIANYQFLKNAADLQQKPEQIKPKLENLRTAKAALAFSPRKQERIGQLAGLGNEYVLVQRGDRTFEETIASVVNSDPSIQARTQYKPWQNSLYFSGPVSLVMGLFSRDYRRAHGWLKLWDKKTGKSYFKVEAQHRALVQERDAHNQATEGKRQSIDQEISTLMEQEHQYELHRRSMQYGPQQLCDDHLAINYFNVAFAVPRTREGLARIYGDNNDFLSAVAASDVSREAKSVLEKLNQDIRLYKLGERIETAAAGELGDKKAEDADGSTSGIDGPSSPQRYSNLKGQFSNASRGISWDLWHQYLEEGFSMIEELAEQSHQRDREQAKAEEQTRLATLQLQAMFTHQQQMELFLNAQRTVLEDIHHTFTTYQYIDDVRQERVQRLALQQDRGRGRGRGGRGLEM